MNQLLQKGRMECIRFVLIFIASRITCSSSEENWPRSAEESGVERAVEGSDVVLRCAGRMQNATAHWEYKACGLGHLNESSCSVAGSASGGWTEVEGSSTGRLTVRAVGSQHQGLYRCRQSATTNIEVHNAVRLEVISKNSDIDLDLPIFLDGLPKNLTVYKDSQAMFQCKVSSHTAPLLLWMAAGAGAGGVGAAAAVRHQRGWYTPMRGADGLGLPGDMYVSKMVLPKARARDAGVYYCVAINTKGYTFSSAYLEVIGSDSEDEWYQISNDSWSLYLLFLLPLALAIGPALLWGFYLWRKKISREKGEYQEAMQYI